MQFNTRIRDARIAQGLTQKQLAQVAGISRSFLAQLENEYKNPSIQTLIKLSNALNVVVTDLLAQQGEIATSQ